MGRALLLSLLLIFAMPVAADGPGLIAAAEKGDLKEVERLIAAKADIHARDGRGRTALLAATHGNHVEVARALIAAGADVNAKDDIQDSSYLYAGASGHLEILKLTLANGADLKSTNRYGGTALIPACERGHVETVRLLTTKSGIDVNHVNNLGWTCLLEIVILGDGGARHQEATKLVLAAGANPNIRDKDGVSPLAHARKRGQGEVARLIEAAGGR